MRQPENYASFMQRCEVHYRHEDVVRISVAYSLGKGHHAHQVRKDERTAEGTPVRYFEHPRRLGLILMDEAHLVSDPDLIVEALLHDTVEDTHLGHEQIRYVFGPEVTRRVLLMSKLPKAGFRARLEAHGDWHVLAVKVADRIDNNRHMTLSSPEFRAKQVAETKDMYYPLADLLVDRAPPGPIAEGCKVLRKLLRDATQEAERIS